MCVCCCVHVLRASNVFECVVVSFACVFLFFFVRSSSCCEGVLFLCVCVYVALPLNIYINNKKKKTQDEETNTQRYSECCAGCCLVQASHGCRKISLGLSEDVQGFVFF